MLLSKGGIYYNGFRIYKRIHKQGLKWQKTRGGGELRSLLHTLHAPKTVRRR